MFLVQVPDCQINFPPSLFLEWEFHFDCAVPLPDHCLPLPYYTTKLITQCRGCSRALKVEKLNAPGPMGSVVANDLLYFERKMCSHIP